MSLASRGPDNLGPLVSLLSSTGLIADEDLKGLLLVYTIIRSCILPSNGPDSLMALLAGATFSCILPSNGPDSAMVLLRHRQCWLFLLFLLLTGLIPHHHTFPFPLVLYLRRWLRHVLEVDIVAVNHKLVHALPEASLEDGGELLLENLEPVLGNGDSHALEELVVEVSGVFQLELVAGESEAIVVDERRIKGCS
ncbi:hypothetical protein Ahy_B01g055280 isoform B [Arachis hypogaea]|uniref:Uncharacterized protein n=1 Tax=Arachis hypogaea TaxID=3818 RepID=A0A445AVQ2_ARAHY|nr:hypothetical protein Ahy_B01g055280 isoform B [Arachis hypogaea]